MGKKKHNNKKAKNRERQNQQEENQQKLPIDDSDIEERRATRLGAIIAIVAVIGTLCAFLFKLTTATINVWSEQGIIYRYLQLLFLCSLSIAVIVFIDIVVFIINDLKRYNISGEDYRKYDYESDNRYMHLLSDFRMYMIILVCIVALVIPLSAKLGNGIQKWGSIVVSCVYAILGIILAVQWLKHSSKEVNMRKIFTIVGKMVKMLFVALLCYIVGAVFIINSKATIKVSYNNSGTVEIYNTSTEDYKGLDINVYNMYGEIIYMEAVEKEDLLFAREDKYVSVNDEADGRKIEEGVVVNSELLHWKYKFNLKEVIKESGEYYISIVVHQDSKSVKLINTFCVENKEYTFAKDSMEKDY